MLNATFKYPFDNPKAYNLTMKRSENWKSASKRILIVLQTVDTKDLRARELLGDNLTSNTVHNAIAYAKKIAETYTDKSMGAAFAVINFNQYRHLQLPSGPKRAAEASFAAHVHALMNKLGPTHILVSGDGAMNNLFPQVNNHVDKQGWVHSLKLGNGAKVKVTSTVDLARLLEKNGAQANLLGFWCRHLANLMLGYHPHSLRHITIKSKYINTIEKFDQVMDLVESSKICATDTETANLSVLHNKIYTIQFATDHDMQTGYIIPLYHPRTPWTKEELKHVCKRLKKFFGARKGPELVTFNGMFDLRVIRRQFKIPIIWHKVWEITAGEHDLDENISSLASLGRKAGNLRAVFCSYENDFYHTAAFSKEERTTIATININKDKGFWDYGGMDVVSIINIRLKQIEMAGHQKIDDKKYSPYFKRHMLYQMSDTAHQLSHLAEDGSFVDARYLRSLIGNESPLRKELKVLDKDMRNYPEVQKANAALVAGSGLKAKGLFGAIAKTGNWLLRLSKPAHLRTLFFDTMNLDPISETDGGEPAVDKEFIGEYKDNNLVVEAYGQYQALSKLLSTYAKGWYKKLTTSKDSVTDSHLRPQYTFFDVDTGRLACKNPNLQTIPTRSKLAKIIKRMFIAPDWGILIRFDYSAHEVRGWSIVSGDKALADVFRMGQRLRQRYIADPSKENKDAVKSKGDVHLLNVKRLFNKIVEKSHPLRDAVKAVVFGLLYGKSSKTLGVDTKKGDIDAVKSKLNAYRKELKELEKS